MSGMNPLVAQAFQRELQGAGWGATSLGETCPRVPLKRGVKQVDPASPALFSLLLDRTMVDASALCVQRGGGLTWLSFVLSLLAFADDTYVIADTPEELATLRGLADGAASAGLTLNFSKCAWTATPQTPLHSLELGEGRAIPCSGA
eukprot:8182645-Alexandrium_andersonii.AAC.1